MATTLDQVCDFLQRDGWRYLADPDAQVVRCRERGLSGRFDIEIRLSEDGDCLHFRVPKVISLGDSPYADLLLARILELHYRIKIGRFGLDPLDGEIDCEVILPIEDATLTYRQFHRCTSALLMLVDQQQQRFRAILATGEDPRLDEAAEVAGLLDQLAVTMGLSREDLAERLAEYPDDTADNGTGRR